MKGKKAGHEETRSDADLAMGIIYRQSKKALMEHKRRVRIKKCIWTLDKVTHPVRSAIYKTVKYGGAGVAAGLLDHDGVYLSNGTVIWGTAGLAALDGSVAGYRQYRLSEVFKDISEDLDENRASDIRKVIEDTEFTPEFSAYLARQKAEMKFVNGAAETAAYTAGGYIVGRCLYDILTSLPSLQNYL
jgi:hypothetical protein